MRATLLPLMLCAFTANAYDDDYQRQADQRRYEQQQADRRMQEQREENQRLEQQRQRLADERRRQDRQDQERDDAQWDERQANRRQDAARDLQVQQRNSQAMLEASMRAGLDRASRKKPVQKVAPRSGCSVLSLPQEQTGLADFTGFFDPDGTDPYLMTSMSLGADGSVGRLTLTAYLEDGVLPTVARPFQADITLELRQPRGPVRRFEAISGSAKFPRADLEYERGRFVAELTDVLLVEMDGYKARVGGACIRSGSLRFTANWSRRRPQ